MTTHDYTGTNRLWGHDLSWKVDAKGHLQAIGWGSGIKEGDFLLLNNDVGQETRYCVEEIEYYRDPPDMWKANLVFAPRQAPEIVNENSFASQPPLTVKEIKARRRLRWFSSRR